MARRYINPNHPNRSVPDSPDALGAWLDLAATARRLQSPGAVLVPYGRAFMARDRGLGEQVRDQLSGLSGGAAAGLRPGNALEGLWRRDAPGARLDGVFDGLGEFARSIRTGGGPVGGDQAKAAKVREVQNAWSTEIPSDGGFLVPEELRSELVAYSLESAIVRPRAINVPMGTLRTAVPMMDATSNASSVLGGFVGYWTQEGAALTEADPAYGRIFLEAKALKSYGTAPNELMSDAPAFHTYLRTALPAALAWWEDHALIGGTGVGEPQGAISAPCAVKVTRATASHVKHADVIGMVTRMWPAGFARACWLCSPDVLTELLSIYELIGSAPTSAAVTPPGWLTFDGGRWTLLGLPLYPTEHVPALGTLGDLALVDFGAMLLGTRELMTMDVSPHHKFGLDVTAIRTRTRVDGRMWPQSSLVPANSSQAVSPVVVLN